MTGKPEVDIAALKAARQLLEQRLDKHENWRALKQLKAREAGGDPIVAIESDKLRASLIAALEQNRAFRAHRALHSAIMALCGEDEPVQPADKEIGPHQEQQADGSGTAQSIQPKVSRPNKMPAANGRPVNGATPILTPPRNTHVGAKVGNSVPTLTLKIATPRSTSVEKTNRPKTAPVPAPKHDADDLTRIWNIGNDLAKRLNARGITTWQQIAAWRVADVKDTASALSLGRQIQTDGWIEQAALLHQRQTGTGNLAPMPLCASDPSATLNAKRTGKPTAAGVAPKIPAKRATSTLNRLIRSQPTSNAAVKELVCRDAQPKSDPALITTAAVIPQTIAPAIYDKLDTIRGIDGALAKRLAELDVKSFAEIAKWRKDDVANISADLELSGRIAQQNWIEQAAILQTGRLTTHARGTTSGSARIVARPPPLPQRSGISLARQELPPATQLIADKQSGSDASIIPPTVAKFTGGLPAALAKLGIDRQTVVAPSHGLNGAKQVKKTADDKLARVPKSEPKPADEAIEQKATPEPSVAAAVDASDLPPQIVEWIDFTLVETPARVAITPDADTTRRAPSPVADNPDYSSVSRPGYLPGISTELAKTLADIDRLSHETEALLGNTKRETPAPPEKSRKPDREGRAIANDVTCEEADVIIVSHSKPSPRYALATIANKSDRRPALDRKIRAARAAKPSDSGQVAAYRVTNDEASVEIVEHGDRRPTQRGDDIAAPVARERAGSIRRFLKALSGD